MVYPLGARLEPSGAPVSLGKSPWSHASIAATETRIAVSLAVPYGAMLFQIGPHGIDKTTPMDGGGKLGLPVHLRASGSSLYATWHDTEWHDEVVDAAFASLNREASAGGGRVALATLEVHGNKLAAITDGRGGARIVRIP